MAPYPVFFLLLSTFLLSWFSPAAFSQDPGGDFPVRGLCIAAPSPEGVDGFAEFIREELGPMGVNTMVLRVEYNYEYTSRPELRSENPLSQEDVEKLVEACRSAGIRIIPQVNLLGHQSWHSQHGKLLQVYPEFDETPDIALPEEYEWPNEDGLYCKSYCPLHPEVHDVIFDVVDEIMDAFDADAFHAGMDEVFYLAMDQCPRCSGRDPAELFAGEVRKVRNHLAQRGAELWIWGDRLIDGKTTGIGMWEASMNNTARAIDMIPSDVVICDWHYEKPVPTAPLFAMKGLRVVTCPWRVPEVAEKQVAMTRAFREGSPEPMREHFLGMMHTVWSGNQDFLDQFYGRTEHRTERGSQADTFRRMMEAVRAAGGR